MKKLAFLFLLFPILCSAQTKKDIFNPQVPVVFFGADYSKVQCTKSDEFSNKPEILRFFVDANNLIDKNWKHIVANKLDRDDVGWDLSYVTAVNASVDWEKVYSDDVDYNISDTDIETMILNLKIDQVKYKNSIGMVLAEENLCKTKPLASAAIVFFSINDLTPILIKHVSIKPGGYGFLAYWGLTNGYFIGKSIGQIKKEIE